MREARYQAGEPHGSTWYLEQTNALGALAVMETESGERVGEYGGWRGGRVTAAHDSFVILGQRRCPS